MKIVFFSISGMVPTAAKKLHWIVMLTIIGSVILGNDVNPGQKYGPATQRSLAQFISLSLDTKGSLYHLAI